MRFNYALCEVCGACIFEIDDLVAYRRGNAGVFHVELEGEQPWSGVRCVCKTCIHRLGEMVK